jgi:LysR family transcriptional regulator, low CO2-responsive transcriptional regulator
VTWPQKEIPLLFLLMKENLVNFPHRTSLRQLRALGAVTSAKSISAAAQLLYLTPPAVSQQLQLLEEALGGVPLYERTPTGMRPTEAGREVLTALERIEAALTDCATAVDALRGMGGGRVSIGVISTAQYFAPFALAAFQRANPMVEIRMLVGNRSEMITGLEKFNLDLALMGYPPEHFPVERAIIGDHPHVIIAAPDHWLATRRKIALADIGRETLLLREPGSGTRALMLGLLAAANLPEGARTEIGSNEAIKHAVMAGMGVALISAHVAVAELTAGRLVALDVEGLPIVRQWFAVRRSERRPLPAAQALWEHLRRSGPGFLPRITQTEPLHPRGRRRGESLRASAKPGDALTIQSEAD